jgi:hypothetical protein
MFWFISVKEILKANKKKKIKLIKKRADILVIIPDQKASSQSLVFLGIIFLNQFFHSIIRTKEEAFRWFLVYQFWLPAIR